MEEVLEQLHGTPLEEFAIVLQERIDALEDRVLELEVAGQHSSPKLSPNPPVPPKSNVSLGCHPAVYCHCVRDWLMNYLATGVVQPPSAIDALVSVDVMGFTEHIRKQLRGRYWRDYRKTWHLSVPRAETVDTSSLMDLCDTLHWRRWEVRFLGSDGKDLPAGS